MADIKLSLTRISVNRLATLAGRVAGKLTDNPHFPEPAVPPAELLEAKSKLTNLISLATNGSLQSLLQRKDAEAHMCSLLRKEADYVRLIAQGNATILTTSGFELRSERGAISSLAAPKGLRARMTGIPGGVYLQCSPVHGAHFYEVWTAGAAGLAGEWQLLTTSTRTRIMLSGLESARYHHFKVKAVGASAKSGMSNIAASLAA
ncbi:MAG: hypothetical protein KA230_13675 [Flavobacteriales bacterium]|nr:hypothetical protein [Flavobacteriales bacterium]